MHVRLGKKWKRGQKEIIGYKKGENHLKRFAENVVRGWGDRTLSIDQICRDMKREADRTLKMKIRLRVCETGGVTEIEQKWMTREIRMEMKENKRLNAKRRHCKEEDSERVEREWVAQRDKVKRMVRDERENFEMEMTDVIKNSRDNGVKLWIHVR